MYRAMMTDLGMRPEIRYDRSPKNTPPFNHSSDPEMLTATVE
jgi:hypothetical protein